MTKVESLTEKSIPLLTDVAYLVSDPGGTPAARKAAIGNLVLAPQSAQTASFTAAVNACYPLNLTSLGANLSITFPSTPAHGDEFEVYVAAANTTDTATSGFASAPFWGAEPAGTTSIEGTSYSATGGDGLGKWGLMLVGERLRFQYDSTATSWMVSYRGQKPLSDHMWAATATTSLTSGQFVTLDFDTDASSSSGMANLTSNKMEIKRVGIYRNECGVLVTGCVDQNSLRLSLSTDDNTTREFAGDTMYASGSGILQSHLIVDLELAAADEVNVGPKCVATSKSSFAGKTAAFYKIREVFDAEL